jgi:hypothetical protein
MMKNISSSRLRINGRIPDGMQKTGGAYFSTERHIPMECCTAELNYAGDIDYRDRTNL